MMKLDRYTTLHRKDERGVIVESGVFGPGDEVPEGFGSAEYLPIHAPREDDAAPVAESELTPWESPVAVRGTWVGQSYDDSEVDDGTPVEARDELTGAEKEIVEGLESDEDAGAEKVDESDDGTPRETREQSDDGDLTDAETEADEELESDEGDSAEAGDEVDEGTPIQARDEDSDEEPPTSGPGSGKAAWEQYASNRGVTVPEGATRDEIIALLAR